MMASGVMPSASAWSRSALEAVALAVDDALVDRIFSIGPVGAVLLDDLGRVDVGEDLEQLLQRVVGRLGGGGGRR